ncbi:MAG TPA: hypothetical protein VMB47_03790 [Candidatus Aquilonibacter sp.]|nr:hypothetical protein [Candidatus Aquilonibacter sp.]
MHKGAKWLAATAILVLALFVAAIHASPQSNSDASGAWTLTVAPAPPAIPPGGSAAAAPAAPEGRGQYAGRGGGPPTLTLKQDGDALTGTLSGGRGPGLPVTGSISGDQITWTVSRRLADGIARPEVYKGTISGDTITGSVAEPTVDPTQSYSVDFTAKRNPAQ